MSWTEYWRGAVADYVTAIAWLPGGKKLVVSSAAGEVVLWAIAAPVMQVVQGATGRSVDCLAVSPDGRFLAAGGQDGTVTLWRIDADQPEQLTILAHPAVWVDRVLWNPQRNELAYGLGRYAQIWDAELGQVVTTLKFESSSVLGMDWHPGGDLIALCGHRGARVWNAQDWDEDPQILQIPSASVAIAWSPDGSYLADGNLDNTLTVVEWARPQHPWVMQGFPGKVRQLAWSPLATATGAPLLATCSAETIVIWERSQDEAIGWTNIIFDAHEDTVQAIAFQPQSYLLASASADGWVCLWQAAQLAQILEGSPAGLSCLSWQPQGTFLAAGGQAGEVIVWGSNRD